MSDESKKTVFRKIVVPQETAGKKVFLVGNTPPFVGKTYELTISPAKGGFTIGRVEGNELHIPFETVSSSHAKITSQEGEFYISDTNSSNGTSLNGNPIEPMKPHQLNHKDLIKFDTYEFIVVDSSRSDLWETLKPLSRDGALTIALYSPKGGTGLSSITINLAKMLAKHSQKKVAIADFNFFFGDILTYSCGKVGPSIFNLIQETNITGEMLDRYLTKGPGYNYLAAPSKAEDADRVNEWGTKNANLIQKILWSLTTNHDFVLIDLKNSLDDISLTALELSNMVFCVGHPEIGHMLAMRKVLDVFDKLKYPETKVKVLINRMGREGTLGENEIKSFLKKDFTSLPNSPDDAILSSHAGQLYVDSRPECPLAQGVENLARMIRGEEMKAVSVGVFDKLRSILGF
jgi:MinD-like ATPase involved in chromosome partitioning or flagellar assembly